MTVALEEEMEGGREIGLNRWHTVNVRFDAADTAVKPLKMYSYTLHIHLHRNTLTYLQQITRCVLKFIHNI